MQRKLIILFLFLEFRVFCTTAKRIHYNDKVFNAWTTSEKNQSDGTSFILINPRQIQQAETTIKHFLTRLTGSIAQPITLSFSDGGNLQSTISEISKIVRTTIMGFAQASGLTTSVRQVEQTPWNYTISDNWFTEGLVQGSLLLYDLVRIGEEIWFTIDRYFVRYNVSLPKDKELLPRKTIKSFKFLSIINDASKFNEKLFKCLMPVKDKRKLTFLYLDQTFVNLIQDLLVDSKVKKFKFNLEPSFFYFTLHNGTTTEKLYVLLCHLLVKSSNYDDCMKELRRVVVCMSSSRQNSHRIITHRTLFVKPWLTAIETLSDCKIYIDEDENPSVRCNFDRKLPKTTTRRVKYIYEQILDRRISKQSPLRRVVNNLGNVFSRSKWSRQFIYDVCQYFMIYQEGHKRLNLFSNNYTKDKKMAARYKKISVSLNLYKNGVLKKIMITIGNFHRSSLAMQKFFIQVIRRNSFKKSWQAQILACLSEWMMKLLELFGCTNLDDTDIDISTPTDVPSINMTDSESTMIDDIYDRNSKMKHLMIYRNKHEIRKELDEIFDRLMCFMNHVNRVQNRNSKSTLVCLANNLLLVTMFMETISFVSTLFCLGEHTNEFNSEELEEE